MLKYKADASFSNQPPSDILAMKVNGASSIVIGRFEARDNPQEGRFARSRRSK
jgi:hypothetical protein